MSVTGCHAIRALGEILFHQNHDLLVSVAQKAREKGLAADDIVVIGVSLENADWVSLAERYLTPGELQRERQVRQQSGNYPFVAVAVSMERERDYLSRAVDGFLTVSAVRPPSGAVPLVMLTGAGADFVALKV